MDIRAPEPADLDTLLAFFERVPEHERTFFKEPVLDRDCVEAWLRDASGRRAIAVEDGDVVGYVAVVPLHGLSDHVGEIRLVTDPRVRRRGVGRALARRALVDAVQELGLGKAVVEVVADQEPAVAMFSSLGFSAEGILRDHVRDRDGQLRDLVVLAHPVGDQWSAMATAGIEDALR